jgi:hypothetical protein
MSGASRLHLKADAVLFQARPFISVPVHVGTPFRHNACQDLTNFDRVIKLPRPSMLPSQGSPTTCLKNCASLAIFHPPMIYEEGDLTILSDGTFYEAGTSLHAAIFHVFSKLPEKAQDFVVRNLVFHA